MSSSRAAIYDDRILEGARAGDLPVDRPTKCAMVVNTLGGALVLWKHRHGGHAEGKAALSVAREAGHGAGAD